MKTEFINLYEELDELWENCDLQEKAPYIRKLRGKSGDDELRINNLRAGTTNLPFLDDAAFNPYFEYLEQIFEANGNSRYPLPDTQREAQGLDAHHIIFRSLGGEDSIQNLIALLRKEHQKAHELFETCIREYLKTATTGRDQLRKAAANAAKSVYILSKAEQAPLSTRDIINLLNQEEEKIEDRDNEELLNKIDTLLLANRYSVVNRKAHGGEENLKPSEKDTYKVSFINGDVVTVSGVAGVQEVIYKRTGKTITKDMVKDRTTTIKHVTNELPPRCKNRFDEFDLQYPYGIYRTTDSRNQDNRRETKPVIYFPVDNNIVADYSKGQWAKSPNEIREIGVGTIDDAYKRLDIVHSLLLSGNSPIAALFKGSKNSEEQTDAGSDYIAMYADDINLLQDFIDNENSKRSSDEQLTLIVMKDNEVWYPSV